MNIIEWFKRIQEQRRIAKGEKIQARRMASERDWFDNHFKAGLLEAVRMGQIQDRVS
jgi:hypothetical protein